MAECKECVHNEVCPVPHLKDTSVCKQFKDRTKYAEVVRCKDCKHRGDDVHCPMCFEEEIEWDDDGYTEVDWITHDHTHDDGYCDRGERKDDERPD